MKKKQIVILGAGESGTGAALLAQRVGYDVFVSDKSPINAEFKADLDAQGIAWEEGQHTLDKILTADEIIKSPGIPETAAVIKTIRAKGIPIIGEIEFGYRYAGQCTIVAITGSNGKTTTTNLIYHVLKTAGLNVRMGGNVGKSFAELVAETVDDGRLTMDGGRWTVDGGRWTVDGGRSTVDGTHQPSTVYRQPSTVHRPPSTVHRPPSIVNRPPSTVNRPPSTVYRQPSTVIYVLEISSFQLDDIQEFRPDIAILLNITPDHLDRYDYEMANYTRSKFRVTMNQGRGDLFITNADDPNVRGFLAEHPGYVRCRMEKVRRPDLKNGYARIGRSLFFDLASTSLKGPHNAFNAACAIRAALRLGVAPNLIAEGLATFTPPPHRLEKVAEVQGVTWINDSKATNVDSVFYALQSMDRPTVWIVGGQDKGNDYAPLLPFVRKRVKAIVCLGVDNSKIISAFTGERKPMVETRSAVEAVQTAAKLAEEGDAVLLSPACASFDLFRNYEDRGDQFKAAVLNLIPKSNDPQTVTYNPSTN